MYLFPFSITYQIEYMKKLLFVVGLLFFAPTLFAQEILSQLELGSRDPKPDYCEYVTEDHGIITMGPMSTASSRNIGIVKYDANFKRQWIKEVVELNPRKTVDFMAVIGEHIFVFVSEFVPREKVIKTFYYKYNINGKVIATDEILAVYPNQQEQKVVLDYQLSPNKKKLLIYKNLHNRRENEQLLYYLIDETGTLVQNGEIKLKYSDEKFTTLDLQVSNNGNVFLLGKFYDASYVRTPLDYKYLIINHNLQTEKDVEFPINGGSKFITNLAFRIDRDENIYVAGFYSNKGTDKIIGTVFQKITPENKIITNVSEPFSEAFLSRFLSNNQIERGRELNNFYMHSNPNDHGIVLRSDGGVLLAAERYYVTTQNYRDYYGYWVTKNIYHYDEVILTSISPEGKIEWQVH